jgi:hypothetical protein
MMNDTLHSNKKTEQSFQMAANSHIDPTFNFELWAGAVKRQMLASLKRRESMRNV